MMLAQIRTVLFDLDGTLTVPLIDFDALRARLDLPAGVPLLHALAPLPEERRVHGMQVIHQAEIEAAHNAVANTGAIELVADLAARGIATAIVTRNSTDASRITLARLKINVDVLVTRDFLPTKPAPAPVLEALRLLRAKPAGALMVGDYADDIAAGRAAGTLTCLVTNGSGPPRFDADLHVPYPRDLHELFAQAWG